MSKNLPTKIAVLVLFCLAVIAVPAAAEPEPSSDLLLPYFEVNLAGFGQTTTFAVGNADSDQAVDVLATVFTNWGIQMIEEPFTLQPGEVRTVNLRDWLELGNLPSGKLGAEELAHIQAAFTGQPSPKDNMFYGTQADPFDPSIAVGYVTFRVQSSPRLDTLWGDYFWVNPDQDSAQGDLLVNIDPATQCHGLCKVHRLRFLNGAGFDGGTKVVIWSDHHLSPSPTPNADMARSLVTLSAFHRESGEEFDQQSLDLLPAQEVDLSQLDLAEPFGWLDLASDTPVWVGVRHSASHRFSVTMESWCLREPQKPQPPGGDPGSIDVEKATNGDDADVAPGPEVETGAAVTWEYVVTNTGDSTLTNVQVTDDKEGAVTCPKTTLAAGESMTCTKTGTASSEDGFQYENTATAVGTNPKGGQVRDTDPSHYHTPNAPPPPPPEIVYAIHIEKATNGDDADNTSGPELSVGDAVTWSYVVTNTTTGAPAGSGNITSIVVNDDKEGAVTCPETSLAPGASMTCTPKHGTAVAGQYENTATVVGHEDDSSDTVSDDDPSHYHASELPPPPPPSGDQGCTPGYWKNHTDSWPPTGYSPAQSAESVFSSAAAYPTYGSASLLQGLSFKGGSGVEGGVGNLLRAAIAALLNTAHSGVDYPRTTAAVISDVDAALASGNRDTMISLAGALDSDNNGSGGCPLN